VHITDYRGFDEVEGWRHRVAHTADLIWNSPEQPGGQGELKTMMQSALLAGRAQWTGVLYLWRTRTARPRGIFRPSPRLLTKDEWSELSMPSPIQTLPGLHDVYSSQGVWRKLHNTIAFLNEVYTTAKREQSPRDPQAEQLKQLSRRRVWKPWKSKSRAPLYSQRSTLVSLDALPLLSEVHCLSRITPLLWSSTLVFHFALG